MHRRLTMFLLVTMLIATSLAIGGVPGVAAVVATGYTATRIGGPDAGNLCEGKTYRMTAFGLSSTNYDLRYQPGTLTIR